MKFFEFGCWLVDIVFWELARLQGCDGSEFFSGVRFGCRGDW
jgi:hypothetical protein